MRGKSVMVVGIGSPTAGRSYEMVVLGYRDKAFESLQACDERLIARALAE